MSHTETEYVKLRNILENSNKKFVCPPPFASLPFPDQILVYAKLNKYRASNGVGVDQAEPKGKSFPAPGGALLKQPGGHGRSPEAKDVNQS